MERGRVSDTVTRDERRNRWGHRVIHRLPRGAQAATDLTNRWNDIINAVGGTDQLHNWGKPRRRRKRGKGSGSPTSARF